MSFTVIIPARYQSSRLPGKPLADIGGKPMIQHVFERALQSGAAEVIVATDDPRIENAVTQFGGRAMLTSDKHQSGTERLAEVIGQLAFAEDEIVVNVQGDEPFIPPEIIRQVADNLANQRQAAMATLSVPIDDAEQMFNPNVVKVVRDSAGYALYFSRAAIPWHRDTFADDGKATIFDSDIYQRHIGLYAYRSGFVRRYVEWPASPLEQIESLEQLRVLWHGERIHVAEAIKTPQPGIDTADDLNNARRLLG
ncbi:3-deoxy-manno-octulosonate cytidylyltransferase [Idiomarina seosinensis]|uniref:3-deoxy-manno-octulosonate cytidylyltransferase n=1 Tax=Idiomarina seosinensis TaxID=281739 RepID=UPI00384DDEDE